jgi:hypothetical protein
MRIAAITAIAVILATALCQHAEAKSAGSLYKAVTTGKHFAKATLTARK